MPKSLRGFLGPAFAQALLQDVHVEDIDAHGGQVALVPILGFFEELDDPLLLVHLHDAEAAGLLDGHGHDADGEVRALGQVVVDHRAVIHLVDVVTRKNHYRVGPVFADEVQVLVDGIGRAGIPVLPFARLVGLQEPHAAPRTVQIPRLADADVIVEAVGTVLRQHTDRINATVDAVAQGEIDDTEFARKGHRGLGAFFGQYGEPCALTACQDHSDCSHSVRLMVCVSSGAAED